MKFLSENEHTFNWYIKGTLEAPICSSDLWDIISSPSNLESFHPFCAKNPTINWPGLNSIDQIYYYSGLILERRFVKWIDNQGYDLFIGKKMESNHLFHGKLNQKTMVRNYQYPYIHIYLIRVIR